MISSVVMQPHPHLRAGYQSYRDRINNFMSELQGPVESRSTAGHTVAEAGIGSREGKGPAVREGPAERHSMSMQMF